MADLLYSTYPLNGSTCSALSVLDWGCTSFSPDDTLPSEQRCQNWSGLDQGEAFEIPDEPTLLMESSRFLITDLAADNGRL